MAESGTWTATAPDGAHTHGGTPTKELSLATLSFTVCFYAWALLGPLGPDLQDQLGLSDGQLALTISIPVVLGSLMRIPLGVLTDRYGGRLVFTLLMAFTPLPLIGLALFNDSWGAVLVLGFLLGFAGASFAVGVPFVNRWYPPDRQGFALGIYGIGMGGTVLARTDRAEDRRCDQPRRPVLDRRRSRGRDGRRVLAHRRGRAGSAALGQTGSMLDVAVRIPRPGQRPRLGADALLLHGLRRLRRDVPLPAEAPRRRPRPVQDRRRRPRRRLRPARRDRPTRSAARCPTAPAPATVLTASFIGTAALALVLAGVLRAHGAPDDRLPVPGRLPRPRDRRRLQARPRVVPRLASVPSPASSAPPAASADSSRRWSWRLVKVADRERIRSVSC